MSTWNDDRLNELSGRTNAGFKEVKGEIKDLRAEMKEGFARVDERFEKVDQEMKEGFAQTVTRDEMNERFSAVDKRLGDLTRWVQIFVGVVGAAFVGNGLLG